MSYLIVFAVVIATAIFLFQYTKIKQQELYKTQELLLQFIEQFEEQFELVTKRLQEQNDLIESKYKQLLQMIERKELDVSIPQADEKKDEHQATDPLQLTQRFQSIVQLHQEGLTVDEIARQTGKGKGEVQLIVELLDKRQSSKL